VKGVKMWEVKSIPLGYCDNVDELNRNINSVLEENWEPMTVVALFDNYFILCMKRLKKQGE
jgi:hypothetical protein